MDAYFPNKLTTVQTKIQRPARMTKSICIAIDSKDRNDTEYTSANQFAVRFNSNRSDTTNASIPADIRNISSIKMLECILPDSVQTHRYLILVIPELTVSMDGTNDTLSKAFCILYPDKIYGSYLHCRMSDVCNCFKKYSPPIGRLNKLTFELYTPDETLISFGGSDEVFYKLEFRTIVANTSELNESSLISY